MRTQIVGVSAVVLLALGLTACGSGDESGRASVTAGTSGAQVQIGNTINYGSVGTTADIDCAEGKSLNIGGSNNVLTVKGTCSSVNVGGADNKITLDNVETKISVVGLDNTVVYLAGDPKIEDLGSGNKVDKG
ncbi:MULTISPECIES: DUF3060 domain-containing protein [Mycolicibacterium]|uniref:Threonine rich protein n=1 Tax=Mycolicibacterium neoaurum TaxID=1795 RepID=A0AAV2WSK7_MYCNE|nr:DUF3060 domain-containing protein [Mycolicibacterium neoaurum]TLH59023.1 DUF3060 domain-containing protein [Mycolicibacterium neoaurum]CDQ46903.1 putative threonine rich protein [Mycolicibacterium neoaurum]